MFDVQLFHVLHSTLEVESWMLNVHLFSLSPGQKQLNDYEAKPLRA